MNYVLFGPFDALQARAISTANPMDCTIPLVLGDSIHLECAGLSCLALEGRRMHATSIHTGGDLTTILYDGARMTLCQRNNPLNGAYICSEEEYLTFSRGFERLRSEKLDPTSGLHKRLNELGREAQKELESGRGYTPRIKEQKPLIQAYTEWISNFFDQKVLEALHRLDISKPRHVNKGDLIAFLDGFYSPNFSGRDDHIGEVLSYFSLDRVSK